MASRTEPQPPDVRLAVLAAGWQERPAAEVGAELVEVWPLAHAPLHRFDAADLVSMFKWAGYVSDGPPQPEAPFTVYRGELAASRPGMSWTADRAVALRYARDYRTVGPTRCLRATIPPRAILARFVLHDEVVVDPAELTHVTVSGSFAQWAPPRFNVGGILDRLGR